MDPSEATARTGKIGAGRFDFRWRSARKASAGDPPDGAVDQVRANGRPRRRSRLRGSGAAWICDASEDHPDYEPAESGAGHPGSHPASPGHKKGARSDIRAASTQTDCHRPLEAPEEPVARVASLA